MDRELSEYFEVKIATARAELDAVAADMV